MKILAPTSGPKPAKDNASYIVNITRSLEGELFVLHILTPGAEGGEEALAIFEDEAEAAGVKVTGVVRKGAVVDNIARFADEISADLIILGGSPGKMVAEWLMADFIVRSKRPMVIIPFGFEGAF